MLHLQKSLSWHDKKTKQKIYKFSRSIKRWWERGQEMQWKEEDLSSVIILEKNKLWAKKAKFLMNEKRDEERKKVIKFFLEFYEVMQIFNFWWSWQKKVKFTPEASAQHSQCQTSSFSRSACDLHLSSTAFHIMNYESISTVSISQIINRHLLSCGLGRNACCCW